MAVTKIHAIKSSVNKAINYITNPDKTDGTILVSGYNCEPLTAHLDFKMTSILAKEVIGDYTKTGVANNLAYHLIQSFSKTDIITAEEAHEIGKKLADELLQGKHEYVIATHVDKGHIHNHIIFNSVSFFDYKKFRSIPYKTVKKIRNISDRLCEEKGLYVIRTKGKGKSHAEWDARRKGESWKAKIEKIINDIVLKAKDYNEFIMLMKLAGVEVKEGKHIAFRLDGQQRYVRGKTIGSDYTKERIIERIAENKGYEKLPDSFVHRIDWIARKQMLKETKELANTLLIIRQENINNLSDFDLKLQELKNKAAEIKANIKALDEKNKNYKQVTKYLAIFKKYLPLILEYEKKSFISKKNFYRKYESEILTFEHAENQLKKLGVDTNVDYQKVLNLISQQTEKINELTELFNNTEKRIKELIRSQALVQKILSIESEQKEKEDIKYVSRSVSQLK